MVESMMDAYRTMPDVIFPVPNLLISDRPMQIHVHKLGGGSPDGEYAGTWVCELWVGGELLDSTADLNTATEHTHYMASGVYADFLAAYGDSGSGASRHIPELPPHVDRLTVYAQDVNSEARRRII
jgi:hypothetical protein